MSIRVSRINKSFGEPPTHVLKDLSFEIADREFVSLTGRSGSGKSTLLYIISTLDMATSGNLEISGKNVQQLSSRDVHHFRNTNVGFVFQFHYLLPELTALENVLMPAMKLKQHITRRPQALRLLEEFGLIDKLSRFPAQLSGGEQQRVAIARALLMSPRYIFADEPTGNLDSVNGDIVMKLLARINKESGTTVVYVTHDVNYAAMAQRQIQLVDGRIA